MSLPLSKTTDKFRVALRIDSALDMTEKEYESYLETCDEGALKLKVPGKQPVFFTVRKVLPYHLALKIENMKMDMVKRKDGDKVTNDLVPKMSWIPEEVRFSIVGIDDPSDGDDKLEFKPDADGACSGEIMSQLMTFNGHMDIWTARQNLNSKDKVVVQKKK